MHTISCAKILSLRIRSLILWRKKLVKTQKELDDAAGGTQVEEESAEVKDKEADSDDPDEIDNEVARLRAEIEKDAKR